jgi:RNA polymerase sigma-70 factor (ECF subfamily)
MNPTDRHLDELSTSWTLLQQAQKGGEDRSRACAALVQRYQQVVRRYLAGALRHDPDAPQALDECEQECWVRLVEGRFAGANPQRGRFRNYLRAVLINLIHDHRRSRCRRDFADLGELDPETPPVSDEEYRDVYRFELLRRTLERLRDQDERTGQRFHEVLQARRAHPDESMEALAQRLSRPGEQTRNAGWVRITLYRARQRLCELLRQEVAGELTNPTPEAVDEELAELRLLAYCQQAG